MSIIVAYKNKDVVYMAADTQVTGGTTKMRTISEFNYKISKLENGILLACSGDVATHQIINKNI